MQKLKDLFEKLKRKIKWAELVSYFMAVGLPYIKRNLSALLFRSLKISGGVGSWILSEIILKLLEKGTDALNKIAKKKDQKNIDETKTEVYEKQISDGGTVEDNIKNGSDFLNDSKP